MATCTFISAGVDNLWSNAANWDSAPVDDDTIIIAPGQTCEYDIDMSTWVNGVQNITITDATIYVTRTPGTYYLKIKSAKTIAGVGGVFDCGQVGDQMPSTVKFTLKCASSCFNSNVTLYVYGQNPSIKQVKLTAGAIVGATVLSVDTDVTGDLWADGDIIGIDTKTVVGVRKGETREIAVGGITSTTITITAGLSYAKNEGDIISLQTRNLRFEGGNNCWTGTTSSSIQGAWFSATGGGWLMGINNVGDGVYTGGSYGYYVGTNKVISNGIWRDVSTVFFSNTASTLSGGYLGNCYVVFSGGVGHSMTGGLTVGCYQVFNGIAGLTVTGGDSWGAWNLFLNSSVTGSGFTFGTNAYPLVTSIFNLYGAKVEGFNNTNYTQLPVEAYSQWYDYDGVAGAYKAWTKGGVTTKQTVTVPTGYTYSMETVLQNASNEGYYQQDIVVSAGASVSINFFLRKTASMTYLPRVLVFDKNDTDPFSGGTVVHTFTMTDSINTWETENYVYTNSGSEAITLTLRVQGKNASGSMFSLFDVDFINVDLTSALAKLDTIDTVVDSIKEKTDTLKNASLVIDGEVIV